MDIKKVTEQYYANNAQKLHRVVDSIIKKFGGLSEKDTDDFYSLANEVFWIAVNDYDGTGTFEGFLYFRLNNKIRSLITQRNRKKRADIRERKKEDGTVERTFVRTLSLEEESKVNNSEGASRTVGDSIRSHFDIDDYIMQNAFREDVSNYLHSLPKKTMKVALLISNGYKNSEIIEKLHIEEKEIDDHIKILKSYEYTKQIDWRRKS